MREPDPAHTVAELESSGTTLLALVTRLGAELPDDEAVVATALRWLDEGRVRLTGNFRGCRLADSRPGIAS